VTGYERSPLPEIAEVVARQGEGLIVDAMRRCGRHQRFVHMHGFKGGVDHFPPFAEGDTLQRVELFRMAREIAYCGDLNFEPKGNLSI
jgi:hypothetical protein